MATTRHVTTGYINYLLYVCMTNTLGTYSKSQQDKIVVIVDVGGTSMDTASFNLIIYLNCAVLSKLCKLVALPDIIIY